MSDHAAPLFADIADRVLDKLDELGQFERDDVDEETLRSIIDAVAEVIEDGVNARPSDAEARKI